MDASPIKKQKYIAMVDAGISFNLPYPPISGERPERKADIIIFLDASGGRPSNEFKKVEEWAKTHNLAFPPIKYSFSHVLEKEPGIISVSTEEIGNRAITVFRNPQDQNCPIVIYMPLVKDQYLVDQSLDQFNDLKHLVEPFNLEECMNTYCDTFNFYYPRNVAEQLNALVEFNVRATANIIWDAIKWFIIPPTQRPSVETATPSRPFPLAPAIPVQLPPLPSQVVPAIQPAPSAPPLEEEVIRRVQKEEVDYVRNFVQAGQRELDQANRDLEEISKLLPKQHFAEDWNHLNEWNQELQQLNTYLISIDMSDLPDETIFRRFVVPKLERLTEYSQLWHQRVENLRKLIEEHK